MTLLWLALGLLALCDAEAKKAGRNRDQIDQVVVHATGGPDCRGGEVVFTPGGTLPALKRYFEGHKVLGIHYLVGRDGKVESSIPVDQVANHAYGHNQRSIGIELINRGDGEEPFPEPQVGALTALLAELRQRHGISLARINRHSDVDVRTFKCGGRQVKKKQDPGPALPWDAVLDAVAATGPKYELVLDNIDDGMTAYLNGAAVLNCAAQKRCSAPLNDYLQPGENALEIEVENPGGDYRFGYEILKDGVFWRGEHCDSDAAPCARFGASDAGGEAPSRRKVVELKIVW